MKRDWRRYNSELVKRGEFLLDLDFLKNWNRELKRMNREKRGKPFKYPTNFIRFLAPVRVFFHLPYRQEEGFVEALSKLVPRLEPPDYTTIYRRVSAYTPEFEQSLKNVDDEIVIAVDSSGVKVTNRGGWVREIWNKRSRKGYLKIHLSVDVKTKQILAMEITSDRVSDSKKFKSLVNEAKRVAGVKRVLSDGAYDSRENFDSLDANGIDAGIKPRRGSSGKARGSRPRMRVVRDFMKDEEGWKRKTGYGERWMIESVFSSLKRTFGEFVDAKKFRHMIQEMKLKAFTYNLLLNLPKC